MAACLAQVPDTGGVYFVPAFSGLLAPHWDDSARGVILGLTGFSNKAHIVRAMLEAICFQSREVGCIGRTRVLNSMLQDAGSGIMCLAHTRAHTHTHTHTRYLLAKVLDSMRQDADIEGMHLLRVDGGATKSDLLMQVQKSLLQITHARKDKRTTKGKDRRDATSQKATCIKEWFTYQQARKVSPKCRRLKAGNTCSLRGAAAASFARKMLKQVHAPKDLMLGATNTTIPALDSRGAPPTSNLKFYTGRA
eukprot:1138173-Pelagomonas_calceolata.AAC.3